MENNNSPVYSVLTGKCSGNCSWIWYEDCNGGYWIGTSNPCTSGCGCSYPGTTGSYSGQQTTTPCYS